MATLSERYAFRSPTDGTGWVWRPPTGPGRTGGRRAGGPQVSRQRAVVGGRSSPVTPMAVRTSARDVVGHHVPGRGRRSGACFTADRKTSALSRCRADGAARSRAGGRSGERRRPDPSGRALSLRFGTTDDVHQFAHAASGDATRADGELVAAAFSPQEPVKRIAAYIGRCRKTDCQCDSVAPIAAWPAHGRSQR